MRPPVGSESSCVFFFDVSSLLFFVEKSERDRKEKKVETELKKLKKNSTTYLADQREAVDGPPRRDRHRVHKRDERQTPRQSERNHRCRREHRPGDDVDFRNAAPGPQSVDGLVVEGERGGGAVGVGPDVHAADLGMVLVAEGVGVLLLFFITFFFFSFSFFVFRASCASSFSSSSSHSKLSPRLLLSLLVLVLSPGSGCERRRSRSETRRGARSPSRSSRRRPSTAGPRARAQRGSEGARPRGGRGSLWGFFCLVVVFFMVVEGGKANGGFLWVRVR